MDQWKLGRVRRVNLTYASLSLASFFSNFSEWGHPPSFSHWILSKIGCRSVVSRMKFYFLTLLCAPICVSAQIVEMFRFSAPCTSSQKVHFSNIPLLCLNIIITKTWYDRFCHWQSYKNSAPVWDKSTKSRCHCTFCRLVLRANTAHQHLCSSKLPARREFSSCTMV